MLSPDHLNIVKYLQYFGYIFFNLCFTLQLVLYFVKLLNFYLKVKSKIKYKYANGEVLSIFSYALNMQQFDKIIPWKPLYNCYYILDP